MRCVRELPGSGWSASRKSQKISRLAEHLEQKSSREWHPPQFLTPFAGPPCHFQKWDSSGHTPLWKAACDDRHSRGLSEGEQSMCIAPERGLFESFAMEGRCRKSKASYPRRQAYHPSRLLSLAHADGSGTASISRSGSSFTPPTFISLIRPNCTMGEEMNSTKVAWPFPQESNSAWEGK